MKALLAAVVAAIFSLFGVHQAPSHTASTSPRAHVASAVTAVEDPFHHVSNDPGTATPHSAPTDSTSSPQATIVKQYITQPVIERIVQSEPFASGRVLGAFTDDTAAKLADLQNQINTLANLPRSVLVPSFSGPAASTPVSTATFAQSQKIDNLSNITLNGVSGLTASDIPALSYMPLSGGTVSGTITVPYLIATSTTAASTFAGFLGIGTSTPWGLLSIQAADNASIPQFVVGSSTATSLIVAANGNVGIGTTSPNGRLHIAGGYLRVERNTSASILSGLRLYDPSTTDGSGHAIVFTSDTTGAGASTDQDFAHIDFSADVHDQATRNGTIMFQTAGAGTLSERMRITSAGNVGIGQTSPAYNLDVTGLGHFTGLVDAANFVATSSATASIFKGGFLSLASSTIGNGTQTGGLTISGGATTTGNACFAGNVGVGTTSPASLLSIGGNVFVGAPTAGGTVGSVGIGTVNTTAGTLYINTPSTNNALTIANSDGFGRVNGPGSMIYGAVNDAYLYAGAASTVVLGAGSSPKITVVNSSGNVGIGTTNPGALLNLFKSGATAANSPQILLTASTTAISHSAFNYNWAVGVNNLDGGKFEISSSTVIGTNNRLVIDGSGNVGIGTSSPYATLSISNSASTAANTPLFVIASTTGGTATTTVLSVASTGDVTIIGSVVTCVIGNGSNPTSCSASDQRLKDNVIGLDASSSLSAIKQLSPVSFVWNPFMVGNGASTSTQFGFIAQDVAKVFPNLVAQDAHTGYFKLDYQGLFAPIVAAIQVLAQKVDELAATIAAFADHFTTRELTFTRATGDEIDVKHINAQDASLDTLCLKDVCVTRDQLAAILAATGQSPAATAGQSSSASSPQTPDTNSSTTPDTPPVIQINGENPAHIHVGDKYADLGATITAPEQDKNLGIHTFLNGALVSDIVLDTSTTTTDTIDYVATDQNGLTSTSTRTVIISDIQATI